jgi:hypothetical protein
MEDIKDKLVLIESGPTHVIASLPPSQDTTPDQIAFFHRPSSIPFVRHSPLPAAADASVGATAAATAKQVVDQVISQGATRAELVIPSIFTPVDQTVNLPGPLEFQLATEPVGTVFQVPPAGGGGGRFDTFQTFFGTSSTPVSGGPIAPSLTNEFALWFVASNGSGPANPSPGVGWTQVSTNPPLTLFTTIWAQPNINAPFSYSAGAPGNSYSGLVSLFFTNGSAPVLAQPLLSNGTLSVPITNTAGNTIIVTISFHNSTVPPSNFSISDSNGNNYAAFPLVTDGLVGGTIAVMYVATNILPGPNTITFVPIGGTATIEMAVMEWKGIIQVTGLPRFALLTSDMIPPIDLSQVNINGGVTGTLAHAEIAATAVTPGSYTSANITVQADGTITAAANGTAGAGPGGSLGDIQIGDGTFFTNLAGRSGGGLFNASNTGNLTIEPIQDLQLNPGQLGFFGATPIAKPTVTGSRGGNAALASLLTTLANQGLLTDSSTP